MIPAHHGVNDDHVLFTSEGQHEIKQVPDNHTRVEPIRCGAESFAHRLDYERPDRVITPMRIANANHQLRVGRRRSAHVLLAFDGQAQEMSRAGDARVVVANRLFATQFQFIEWQMEVCADELAKILLDRRLVLRGRGDDRCCEDGAVFVEPVAVVEQPAWRFGRSPSFTGPGGNVHEGCCRRLVCGDDADRILDRSKHLESSYDDAAERISHDGPDAELVGEILARPAARSKLLA